MASPSFSIIESYLKIRQVDTGIQRVDDPLTGRGRQRGCDCLKQESNPRPLYYEYTALPTELFRLKYCILKDYFFYGN